MAHTLGQFERRFKRNAAAAVQALFQESRMRDRMELRLNPARMSAILTARIADVATRAVPAITELPFSVLHM